MVDLAEITSLIGGIYEAAIEERGWPEILQRSLALIGGSGAILHWSHSRPLTPSSTSVCSAGADPYLCPLYASYYMDLEQVIAHEEGLPVGAVFAASDALGAEQLHASAFGNLWLRPQGCTDVLISVLERSADCLVRLLVTRHEQQGAVDERARHTLTLLAPHLQRAVRVAKLLDHSYSRALALDETLKQLTTAVIFVDRGGRLVEANRAGLQRLAEGDIVYWSSGRPRLRPMTSDTRLQTLLATGTDTRASGDFDSDTSALLERGNGERVALKLLPLPYRRRRGGTAPQAAAAILLAHHVPALTQRIQWAARHYAFTPAEARVVQALMGGCTIGTVARQLGVTAATVKTHLQHVFDKTDTRRQVDLVKRIADHAPPPTLQRSLGPAPQLGLGA
jgi:DNA-binding CsgD family transcriptional regulator